MDPTGGDRRDLASRLRELRERAGLSTTQLADDLRCSQSKVSKIENARTRPTVDDVAAWLTAVGAPEEERADLLAATESLHNAALVWGRTVHGGRAGHQHTAARLLADATRVAVFQSAVVPELLQTAEYARGALRLADVPGRRDPARAAVVRVDQQAVLYQQGRTFDFVITEAALRFPAGSPTALAAQYDRILSIASLPEVSVAVLPTGAEPSTAQAHPFAIYELPDGRAFVVIETYTRELTLTDPAEVAVYQRVQEALRADAMRDDRAGRLLAELRDASSRR